MLERFTLFSDFFMHAVFSRNRKAVQLLARIVTGKKDLIVVEWGLEVKLSSLKSSRDPRT